MIMAVNYNIFNSYIGRMGSQIIVPHRGDEYYCKHLKVMGDLGQIHLRVSIFD